MITWQKFAFGSQTNFGYCFLGPISIQAPLLGGSILPTLGPIFSSIGRGSWKNWREYGNEYLTRKIVGKVEARKLIKLTTMPLYLNG